jgi:hypothetical protein
MRSRAVQLACLLLLLTSVGATESSSRGEQFSIGGHYISVLLRQNAATARPESPLVRHLNEQAETQPPFPAVTIRSVWTMRPPAAHSAALHTLTAAGR